MGRLFIASAREQRRGGFPSAPALLYGLTHRDTGSRTERADGEGPRRKEHNNNGRQIPPVRYATRA